MHCYKDEQAFEVEFVAESGETLALLIPIISHHTQVLSLFCAPYQPFTVHGEIGL